MAVSVRHYFKRTLKKTFFLYKPQWGGDCLYCLADFIGWMLRLDVPKEPVTDWPGLPHAITTITARTSEKKTWQITLFKGQHVF